MDCASQSNWSSQLYHNGFLLCEYSLMDMTTNNSDSRLNWNERGTSVLEFVLILPSILLVIVILIGIGQTVILRQHALVAARYSAFYQRITGSTLPGQLVPKEVSGGDDTWTVTAENTGQTIDMFSSTETGSGPVVSLFAALVSDLDQGVSLRATVSSVPQRNVVVEIFRVGKVSAAYSLPRGDWSSANCGSYLSLLLDKFKIAGIGVHL